jgi:DUF971 family protein
VVSDQTITPTHVKAPHGAQATEITWADGARCVYPNEVLRGLCPCAGCQGHGGTIEFVEGGDSRLKEIEQVGNYALKIAWGDGHDTGIYSFRYLRELCGRPDVQCIEKQGGAVG